MEELKELDPAGKTSSREHYASRQCTERRAEKLPASDSLTHCGPPRQSDGRDIVCELPLSQKHNGAWHWLHNSDLKGHGFSLCRPRPFNLGFRVVSVQRCVQQHGLLKGPWF